MKKQKKALIGLLIIASIMMGVLFTIPFLDRPLKRFVVQQIASRLNAEVQIDDLKISLLPPLMEFKGIEIKRTSGPLRYLRITRGSLRPGVGPIFLGRIEIDQVEIEEPVLDFDLTASGGAKTPAPKSGLRIPHLKDLLRINVNSVAVRNARLELKLTQGDLELRIGNGNAAYKGRGSMEEWRWQGTAELQKGDRSLSLESATIVASRMGDIVELKQFEISGLGATANLKGRAYPDPDLFLQVKGTIEPIQDALLRLGILEKTFDAKGRVAAQGWVRGSYDRLKWAGEFIGSDLELKGRKVPRLAFSFRVRRDVMEAASGEIDFGGSTAKFTVSELRPGSRGQFEVRAEEVPFSTIEDLIKPGGKPDLETKLNVDVRGELGFQPWVIESKYSVSTPFAALTFPPEVSSYLALEFYDVKTEGRFGYGSPRGFFLESGVLAAKGVEGTYGFEIGNGSHVTGTWNGKALRMADVFPSRLQVQGEGKVTGGLEAEKGKFTATLGIEVSRLEQYKRSPGQFTGTILFQKGSTTLKDFRLRTDKGGVTLNAFLPHHGDPGLSVTASVDTFDLGWLADEASQRLHYLADLEGTASGQLDLSGASHSLSGAITISATDGTFSGESFSKADLFLDFENGHIIVQKGQFVGRELSGAVKGMVAEGACRACSIKLSSFPLRLLPYAETYEPLAKYGSGVMEIEGDLEDPKVELHASFFKVLEQDASVGEGNADGKLSDMAWHLDFQNGKFRGAGRVNARHWTDFEGEGTFSDFMPTLPSIGGDLKTSGEWRLRGNFKQAASWNGEVLLRALEFKRADYGVALASPARVQVTEGLSQMNQVVLTGSATELHIDGSLRPDRNLSLHMEGNSSLGILSVFFPILTRGEGEMSLNLEARGDVRSPSWFGKLNVERGLLQFKGFPHSIEDLRASASLDQRRIFFDRIDGRVGGGTVNGGGELLIGPTRKESSVLLRGTVDHASLRFPAWLPGTVSGTIGLVGNLQKPTFQGDLLVHSATYQDNWDWKSKILTFRRAGRIARIHREDEEKIGFDLFFHSDGNSLMINNNLATGRLRGEMRLVGSEQTIGLLGKIEVVEGKVSFLDNEFQLTSGVIRFEDPRSVQATFDIDARTTVQQTDILLDIRSEKDQIVAFLSSQPVKDETNIVALLTLGVDTDELAASGSANPNLSQTILPSVISGPVQARLETGLKKARIIDTLQFVPYFSEDTKTTGLKLIAGRYLFPKVRLLYATDLFEAGAENTVTVEQRFNRNVSLQGSLRDNKPQATQDYDVGLDLEFRIDF